MTSAVRRWRHGATQAAPRSEPGRPAASLRFAFAPGILLEASGDRAALRHLAAEYGAVRDDRAHDADEPSLRVDLSGTAAIDAPSLGTSRPALPGLDPDDPWLELRDGHRVTRWVARLGDPGAPTLAAAIATTGPFGRSFAQGFVIEPLLSIAAARHGAVLLPGAGIELPEGLVLVVGGSGAGKSTLVARALAAGFRIAGDDQVMLEPGGLVRPFARRLRLYSDLRTVAPEAAAALPAATRLEIAVRAAAERSIGRRLVLPTLVRVPRERLTPPLPIARVLLVERGTGISGAAGLPGAADATPEPLEPGELVRAILALSRSQRARLAAGTAPDLRWRRALEGTAEFERAALAAALRRVPAARLRLPAGLDAREATATVAAALGLAP